MRALRFFSVGILFLIIAGNVFAQQAPLTIEASEGPAQVILDGRLLGIANPQIRVQVAQGTYMLLVRKPGLPEFRQRITVGPSGLSVYAQLGGVVSRPIVRYFLSVTSNVTGAEVYLNNSRVGRAPVEQSLSQGEYSIRVSSPGYQDYITTVNLNKDMQVVATLRAQMAELNVVLPDQILNKKINRPEAQIDLYINGYKIRGLSAQLEPGRHQIMIQSGGLSFETTIDVRPGESYTIEPVLGFKVR